MFLLWWIVVYVLQQHEAECQYFPLKCEACEKNNIPRYKVPDRSSLNSSVLVPWSQLFFELGTAPPEKKKKKSTDEGGVRFSHIPNSD